ncbi:MAG TPA: crossover junction endodeoxyribonuclease RuvC [Blastocatellia bacterium]|nr:crossover junction endodeoxyribonuclease RuvC [Blastocatellia bacterium]
MDDDLAYYTLKTIRPRHPRRALLQTVSEVIERLIRDFEPSTLAIEHVPLVQKSEALLSVVADEIRITAASAGLVVKEYDPRQVRSRICESFEATNAQTALRLCQRYPELSQYLNGRSKSHARYYGHLFAAVAVGLVCSQETVDPEQPVIHTQQQVLF